ncbi:MAG: DUF222 domain-containing protein, partial [Actinomycetota bacterium]|nr:DUF222 domain-containing protein [Actinomycetota bacterium]
MFDTPNGTTFTDLDRTEIGFGPDLSDLPVASDSEQWIPFDLDDWEPGPVLAAFMSGVDVDRLSGEERVVLLRTHQKLVSHFTSKAYEDMVAIADALEASEGSSRASAVEFAEAEVRAALNLTRRAAQNEMAFALDLQARLPIVADLLRCGRIDVRRAKAIDNATVHLTDEAAQAVVARIADAAPNLTTSQLTARIAKLAIQADPYEADKRYTNASDGRRVYMEPTIDGTANLYAFGLSPDRVSAVSSRINTMALSLKREGEDRTMDQIRADVFLDLLLGAKPNSTTTAKRSSNRGTVDIRVDLDTLAGLSHHPGELQGYGPVIADIARRVADTQHDAEWRFTVADTQTGQPIHTGTTRRRPTATQRRHIESRNPTCVFPGCRMPSTQCDLDHRIMFKNGGPTSIENLTPLCRHDHRIRHQAGWEHETLNDGT